MADHPTPRPDDRSVDELLLDIADRAIVEGLDGLRPTPPELASLPAALSRPADTFVTVKVRGGLNGCIGSVERPSPLAASVAGHAWSAAFEDPRLPALRWADYEEMDTEISVLSHLSPIEDGSAAALIGALRPGIDGLLIRSGSRRAVFLPTVWEQLPSADRFVTQLFAKAGLASAPWPDDLRASRFTTRKIHRDTTTGR